MRLSTAPQRLSQLWMMTHKKRRERDQKLLYVPVPIFWGCGAGCSWT